MQYMSLRGHVGDIPIDPMNARLPAKTGSERRRIDPFHTTATTTPGNAPSISVRLDVQQRKRAEHMRHIRRRRLVQIGFVEFAEIPRPE